MRYETHPCCIQTRQYINTSARRFSQVEAVKELSAFVSDHPQELTSNLDLILKMCSLRMTGRSANTSLVLSVLELLRTTLQVLVANDYRYARIASHHIHPSHFNNKPLE